MKIEDKFQMTSWITARVANITNGEPEHGVDPWAIYTLVDAGGIIDTPFDTRLVYNLKHEITRRIPNVFCPDRCDVGDAAWREYSVRLDSGYDNSNMHRWIHFYKPVLEKAAPDDLYWLWRENSRFLFGDYQSPLMFEQFRRSVPDAHTRMAELWWQFPHISVEEPSMVAYTPSVEYGVRDRQVRTKLGRYLTQFFGDLLSPEVIRGMANGVKGLTLKFGDTRDDFRYVYANGPSSCMGGEPDRFGIRGKGGEYLHPVDAYLSGEFRIAWLEDKSLNNLIVARAVVHEPSKIFVRVYGDEHNALREKLEEEGYSYACSYPDGARLLCIRDRHEDCFVLPYIDGDTKNVTRVSRQGQELFEITSSRNSDFYCNSTGGEYRIRGLTRYCNYCEEDVEIDDEEDDGFSYSSSYGGSICRGCQDDHFTWAYSRRGLDYVHNDNVVSVGDEYYDSEYLDQYDIVYSEHDGDYYHIDDVVADADGYWIPKCQAIQITDTDRYVAVYDLRSLVQARLVFEVDPESGDVRTYDVENEGDVDVCQHTWFMDDFGTLVSPTVFSGEQLAARMRYSGGKISDFLQNLDNSGWYCYFTRFNASHNYYFLQGNNAGREHHALI